MNATTDSQRARPPNANPDPPVTVQHHQPHWDDPGAEVWKRIESSAQHVPACVFLNPRATVSCEKPTPRFFRTVRKLQARWCQQCKTTFARQIRRSVKDWVNASGSPNRESRYWDRAASFTGLLFINDSFVPPHQWHNRKPKRPNGRHNPNSVNAKNLRQSANESIPYNVGNV